ncbi:transposase [Ruegeria pomeroyi]|nr:transposase [Ruegeria pomeroyi]
MAGKREKPEDIVAKLRQVEVLQGQGAAVGEAVRQIGITQQTFYRWRKLYGGMGRSQLARLKELEKENQRLRRAMSSSMRLMPIPPHRGRGSGQPDRSPCHDI